MKFARRPLLAWLTMSVVAMTLAITLSATIAPVASNANAADINNTTKKHAHKHAIPSLPPRRFQIQSKPLGQPTNPPKQPETRPFKKAMLGNDVKTANSYVTDFAVQAATACSSPTVDLKMLVLASDGTESDLPAIQQALDYLGTPYTVYIASQHPNGLTADTLSNGCHGYYQGVILTNGLLVYNNGSSYVSALSQQEWTNLWSYEANLGIRELSWYTYPTSDFGYQAPSSALDTTSNPLSTTLTSQGQTAFSYMNTGGTVPIQYAYTYLAKPLTDGGTTPILTDTNGNALAAIRATADGRQTLSLTFDSNSYLIHDLVLSYGLVNWVTNGLFLGERHVYTSAQSDDLFIDDNVWPASTACGTDVEQTGAIYRITGSDLQTFLSWQQSKQGQAISQNFRTTMAFNGYGTTADAGYNQDTLTPAAKTNQAQLNWINHTYDHTTLDNLNYADSSKEITQNNQIATQLGLTNYSTHNMVTPNVSGLTNANFLQAAYDNGIRYLVTDTSVAGYNNPSPNAGIYNTSQPSILMIPRRPNNLFYNVSQPSEWVAEYNCLYSSYWGRNLSYQEILNQESQTLLTYLLKGDIDPWMFHQPNMRAYSSGHTLLGDLLDLTFQKYSQYYNLPLVNKTMDDLGATVANRMQYNKAGVTASIVPGVSITLTAQQACRVPVTGLNTSSAETYGGQKISYVSLSAGQSVTLPLQ
jgi:hypothetical protein